MNCAEVAMRVRQFVMQNVLYARADESVSEDDPLFETGIVDPADIWEIIEFLRSEFGVIVEDREITVENLGTIGAITEFVCTRSVARDEP